ncbi:MAG: hypothetical protein ACYC27_14605 [Armatimonadota bacterium]
MNKLILGALRKKFVGSLPWNKLQSRLSNRIVVIVVNGKMVSGLLTKESAENITNDVKDWIEDRL